MAAISKIGQRYFAVHGVTGRKLVRQPAEGFLTSLEALQFAAQVCKKVMGADSPACSVIQSFPGTNGNPENPESGDSWGAVLVGAGLVAAFTGLAWLNRST